MGLVDEYKAHLEETEKKFHVERVEREVAEKRERKSVIDCIGQKVKNFSTNGYVYQFDYKGIHVVLCNQTDRIVGEFYNIPSDEDEYEMLEHACVIEHENPLLYAKIVNEFRYNHFCIDGDLLHGVKRILGMVDDL